MKADVIKVDKAAKVDESPGLSALSHKVRMKGGPQTPQWLRTAMAAGSASVFK